MPYWESLFGEKYLKGTVVLMFYSFFFQWSGVNVILMLSNRILTIMNEHVELSHKIRGNQATQFLGLSAFFLTFISLYTVNRFPRKKLMMT